MIGGWAVVPDAIAWLGCEVLETTLGKFDHDLFFARVIAVGEGRLEAPPLLYSSRLGWRVTGESARQPGDSVRDRLLARLAELGADAGDEDGDEQRSWASQTSSRRERWAIRASDEVTHRAAA